MVGDGAREVPRGRRHAQRSTVHGEEAAVLDRREAGARGVVRDDVVVDHLATRRLFDEVAPDEVREGRVPAAPSGVNVVKVARTVSRRGRQSAEEGNEFRFVLQRAFEGSPEGVPEDADGSFRQSGPAQGRGDPREREGIVVVVDFFFVVVSFVFPPRSTSLLRLVDVEEEGVEEARRLVHRPEAEGAGDAQVFQSDAVVGDASGDEEKVAGGQDELLVRCEVSQGPRSMVSSFGFVGLGEGRRFEAPPPRPGALEQDDVAGVAVSPDPPALRREGDHDVVPEPGPRTQLRVEGSGGEGSDGRHDFLGVVHEDAPGSLEAARHQLLGDGRRVPLARRDHARADVPLHREARHLVRVDPQVVDGEGSPREEGLPLDPRLLEDYGQVGQVRHGHHPNMAAAKKGLLSSSFLRWFRGPKAP
mmetsp:Transcript_21120/g.68079  ORF Transcript_21120/g.68079 Transcript_21120/m.68079 type:complete len:418 (-) Transcript_21120:64-1317(-)